MYAKNKKHKTENLKGRKNQEFKNLNKTKKQQNQKKKLVEALLSFFWLRRPLFFLLWRPFFLMWCPFFFWLWRPFLFLVLVPLSLSLFFLKVLAPFFFWGGCGALFFFFWLRQKKKNQKSPKFLFKKSTKKIKNSRIQKLQIYK